MRKRTTVAIFSLPYCFTFPFTSLRKYTSNVNFYWLIGRREKPPDCRALRKSNYVRPRLQEHDSFVSSQELSLTSKSCRQSLFPYRFVVKSHSNQNNLRKFKVLITTRKKKLIVNEHLSNVYFPDPFSSPPKKRNDSPVRFRIISILSFSCILNFLEF